MTLSIKRLRSGDEATLELSRGSVRMPTSLISKGAESPSSRSNRCWHNATLANPAVLHWVAA